METTLATLLPPTYYAKNTEKCRTASRAYYQANKEKCNAYQREYYQRVLKEKRQARRAATRGTPAPKPTPTPAAPPPEPPVLMAKRGPPTIVSFD